MASTSVISLGSSALTVRPAVAFCPSSCAEHAEPRESSRSVLAFGAERVDKSELAVGCPAS